MKILTSIAILAIPLAGYSSGAVIKNGDSSPKKVLIWDIFIVAAIWICAIHSSSRSLSSTWILLTFWFAVGITAGYLSSLIAGGSRKRALYQEVKMTNGVVSRNDRPNAWRFFFRKIGDFQARILLGFLSLIIFMPISLIVRLFSDYLNVKKLRRGSHWVPKKEGAMDIGAHKKQF